MSSQLVTEIKVRPDEVRAFLKKRLQEETGRKEAIGEEKILLAKKHREGEIESENYNEHWNRLDSHEKLTGQNIEKIQVALNRLEIGFFIPGGFGICLSCGGETISMEILTQIIRDKDPVVNCIDRIHCPSCTAKIKKR